MPVQFPNSHLKRSSEIRLWVHVFEYPQPRSWSLDANASRCFTDELCSSISTPGQRQIAPSPSTHTLMHIAERTPSDSTHPRYYHIHDFKPQHKRPRLRHNRRWKIALRWFACRPKSWEITGDCKRSCWFRLKFWCKFGCRNFLSPAILIGDHYHFVYC